MRREEGKPSKITNDVIVYLGNPRESPKKLLGLMREFSKVPEHMLSIEKPNHVYATKTDKWKIKGDKRSYSQ